LRRRRQVVRILHSITTLHRNELYGRRILSWARDNTLRLWDVATGAQIGPPMKHDGDVKGASFTQDERRILCAVRHHKILTHPFGKRIQTLRLL
jgi:hypothetical protein